MGSPVTTYINGKQFGMLFVMNVTGKKALCCCDCGKTRTVNKYKLTDGSITHCGCKTSPPPIDRIKRSHLDEYHIWAMIKCRCYSKNDHAYKNYGGRGITVCDRWFVFDNFILDMGLRPSKKHSIDRIDNDKGYSPENCRWATPKEQMRNTRRNVRVEFKGKSYSSIAGLADFLGLDYYLVRTRLINNIPADKKKYKHAL